MNRRVALSLCTLAATLVLSGCFTGQRPSFNSDPLAQGVPTGDGAIDDVLSRLDLVTDGPATGVYTVLTKFGMTTVSATVALNRDRRVVEVGSVRYLDTGEQQLTCTLQTDTETVADCTVGFDPTRISDTGITIDFYAAEAAKRLRRDAQAELAPAVSHQEVIANQDATCVAVTLAGGTATYCVLLNGMIAKLDDGDVTITLGLLVPTVDGAKFQPPNP
ncbi:MAG: hypothetical protein K8R99_14910 [Actinomycetia bacterium]|nr:hypothetical protein [Actinomycetes bacterium]